MSVLFLGFVGVAVLAGLAVFTVAEQRRIDAAWAIAANQLGLQWSGLSELRQFWGRVEGFSVTVAEVKRGSGDSKYIATRIVVSGPGIPQGLVLGKESGWLAAKKFVTGDDVKTGDDAFDREIHVEGPDSVVLAALNARARRRVQPLVGTRDVKVVGSHVEFEVRGRLSDPRKIVEFVHSMVAVADTLSFHDDDVPHRLQENVRTDPVVGTRRRNLEVLTKVFGSSKTAREAARSALEDKDPSMRLAGCRLLGRDGTFDVLVGLASARELEAERIEALGVLSRNFPLQRIEAVIDLALGAPRVNVRAAGVRAVADTRDFSRLDRILSMGSIHCAEEQGEAVVAAIRKLGDPRGEPTLLTLLEHPEEPVRRASAKALGVMGTVAAVEPLMEVMKGLILPGALKEAARDAVRQIQSRLGAVEGGRISLASSAETEGAISLAEAGGELSLSDDASRPTPNRVR